MREARDKLPFWDGASAFVLAAVVTGFVGSVLSMLIAAVVSLATVVALFRRRASVALRKLLVVLTLGSVAGASTGMHCAAEYEEQRSRIARQAAEFDREREQQRKAIAQRTERRARQVEAFLGEARMAAARGDWPGASWLVSSAEALDPHSETIKSARIELGERLREADRTRRARTDAVSGASQMTPDGER